MKKNDRDVARKRYFKKKERIADLVNVLLRCTKEQDETAPDTGERLKAEDVSEISQELCTIAVLQEGKYSRKRTVDAAGLIKMGDGRCCFFLENQELTDYRMPERILNGESIWYHENVNQLQKEYQMVKAQKNSVEMMSGIGEKDRLIPVISMVIYYGNDQWEGAKNLHGLLELDALPQATQRLVNNYEMHVLEISSFEHLEWFTTDLKVTFGFIKYAGEEEKLREFVKQHQEAFENLSEDAYDFIAFQTGTRKLEQFKQDKREEKIDMCKAIDDMERHAEERGRKLGEEIGVKRGEKRGEKRGRKLGEARMEALVKRLLEENRLDDLQKVLSNRDYRGRMYQKYEIE